MGQESSQLLDYFPSTQSPLSISYVFLQPYNRSFFSIIFTMKFSLALIAAVASQVATAFKIPEGTPDGIYQAYYDSDGNEVHERIGDNTTDDVVPILARSQPELSPLQKRNEVWCGCGIHMQGGDCDDATHDVERQLGSGGGSAVPPTGSTYSKRGAVVAFFCNHERSPKYANDNDARNAWAQITNSCNYYIAGTWQVDGGLTAGYMASFMDFCAHDRDANVNHC